MAPMDTSTTGGEIVRKVASDFRAAHSMCHDQGPTLPGSHTVQKAPYEAAEVSAIRLVR
jgi:hypothetical protein